jgi:hypothetical protein
MAEELRKEQKGYKIWKHPLRGETAVSYMGEFYPPSGQVCFFPRDLQLLGLGPGRYSVLAPPTWPYEKLLARWQTVVVKND